MIVAFLPQVNVERISALVSSAVFLERVIEHVITRSETENFSMMDAFTVTLEARYPAIGRFRAYRLKAGTDLFGDWLVEITYGRIGTSGRRIRSTVQDETQARELVPETLRRRATAHKRIGVSYRFCQLSDPHQWFPVKLSN
jgi:hypothetical protein